MTLPPLRAEAGQRYHPGAITRGLDGLTTKVLNECLRRLIGLGLLERMSYPEIPPRVEYKLTKLGERFVLILDAVEELQLEIETQGRSQSPKNTDVSAR